MSEPSFEELQRLWQAPPSAAASAAPIILRQRRRRWLSHLYLGSEIVATIAGILISIWLALKPDPDGLALGLGMLVFTLLCAGASLWARSVKVVRTEDPLLASIDQGVRRARIGVRLAYATLWAMVAAMIFMSVLEFAWWSASDLSAATARRITLASAFQFIFMALYFSAIIIYLWARSRELTQMLLAREALRRQQ
jgi:hypothetical protein